MFRMRFDKPRWTIPAKELGLQNRTQDAIPPFAPTQHSRERQRKPGEAGSRFGVFRQGIAVLATLACAMGAAMAQASAQDGGIMESGDLVITGFSGTKPPADGSGNIDKTFIDVDGASLKVFRVGGPGSPRGQQLDAPVKFQAFAKDIGQVFGVALDAAGAPNIYVTATSVHGLQIVGADGDGDGLPDRLRIGQADAHFMEGQFGTALGGGPGSVWKIDGVTGDVNLFANIQSGGQPNSGPGLGNISYDPAHYQLYVSDLDTGIIHRLGMTGAELGTFDHGTQGRPAAGLDAVNEDMTNRMDITSATFDAENADTWGFADVRRRVWGLAYHKGRIYYGIEEGPQIWSIGIKNDGSFASDARVEVDLVPGGFPVSDILFTSRGRMVLAQRGNVLGSYDYTRYHAPKVNMVLRYRKGQSGNWIAEPDEYAIGFPVDHKNTSGGVGLACNDLLWSTGDALRDNPELADRLAMGGEAVIHGVQGNKLSLVRPRNVPPWSSFFVDYDGQYADAEKAGHVGDVEVYRRCEGGRAETWPGWTPGWTPPTGWLPPPWWLRTPDLEIEKADSQCSLDPAVPGSYLCTFDITVTNVGAASFTGHLNIVDNVPGNVDYVPPPGGSIPWACAQPGGSGTPISCTSQNVETLLPGESETLQLTIRRTPLFQGDTLHNCAIIEHPGDPETDAWPGDPNGNNEDCGEAYPPGPDLEMQKTLNQCFPVIPGTICTFWLDVTNVGNGVFNGSLHVVENLPAGAIFQGIVSSSHPGWNCWAINPGVVDCTLPGPVTMFPGDWHWVEISIYIPPGNGGNLENCVHLGNPEHLGDPDINGNNSMCIPFVAPTQGPPVVPLMGPAINFCPQGWTKTSANAPVAKGWQRKKIGSGNKAVYCNRKLPVRFYCPKGWKRFPSSQSVPRGWKQTRVGSGNKAIICARYAPPPPPPIYCPDGWTKFPGWNSTPKGWMRKRVRRGARTIICAKPRQARFHCPDNWRQFPSWNRVPKGWKRMRVGQGPRSVICGKTQDIIRHCPKDWKQFPSWNRVPKGWKRMRVGQGRRSVICGKPKDIIKHCPRGTVGRWPNCKKIIKHCPKGTIGKWPNCKKIVKHCPKGMIGRWPNCKKIIKRCPRGTIGKWPNCRRPQSEIPTTRPPGPSKGKVLKGPVLKINPQLKRLKRICPPGTRNVKGRCLTVLR